MTDKIIIKEQVIKVVKVIARGPAGPGVLLGGLTGQVLTKTSDTDFDTAWATPVSTATLASALVNGNVSPGTTTTGNSMSLVENVITTGKILSITSDSADASARDLVLIHNDNALATSTTALRVLNDSTGPVATFTGSGGIAVGTMLVKSGAITDSSGAISFGNENLITTGSVFARDATLDQNGDATALSIDSEATTANVINIANVTTTGNVVDITASNALTTGKILNLASNSADTSTRELVLIKNDNSLATGTVPLSIVQDAQQVALNVSKFEAGAQAVVNIRNLGTGAALNIDQDAQGVGINIDTESTFQPAIEVQSNTLTSGESFRVDNADALTTGSIISVKSNSASTSTRNLVEIVNDNALATGTVALQVQQDSSEFAAKFFNNSGTGKGIDVINSGTGSAVLIDQNGDGSAMVIDSEGTSAHIVDISGNTLTTGSAIRIDDLDSLSTGRGLFVRSNSSSTSARDLVSMHNDNTLATGTTVLGITQDAAATGLLVDMNGAGIALVIDSESPATALDISAKTTTGNVLEINNANDLTAGRVALFHSNSADASSRQIMEIVNDNVLAVGATGLSIRQDSLAKALILDQNGNGVALFIDTEATSQSAINIDAVLTTTASILSIPAANSLTTGKILNLVSNSSNSSSRNLVEIVNLSASATGTTVLDVQQTADNRAMRIDQNGNGAALELDSEATSAPVIVIPNVQTTTGDVIRINDANALTTGKILNLISNSADTTNRDIVGITNDNVLATGAVVLRIRQDANKEAVIIDQNGNATALFIDSEATSGKTLNITSTATTGGNIINVEDANSLTTGRLINIASNSADTSGRQLVRIFNDNPLAVNATPLELRQDAPTRALFIDQDGNGTALEIDTEATSQPAINILTPTISTNNVINIAAANSLTTGKILNLVSDSSDATVRDLVKIRNDNTLATGATVLSIQQDATKRALFIDQNADGTAIEIDSESTTTDVIDIATRTTIGRVLNIIDADSLTTGRILNIRSDGSDTSSRTLVQFTNDNTLATGATVLSLQQDADRRTIHMIGGGNGSALDIDSAATTANVIDITNAQTTTGLVLSVTDANALTTGKIANFVSNSADVSTRTVVQVTNDNTLAIAATVLTIRQDAANRGLFLDMNGNGKALNIDSEATTANTIDITGATTTTGNVLDIFLANALTTGRLARFSSNSTSTATRNLVEMTNDNSLATGATVLRINQDAAQTAVFIDQNQDAAGLIIDAESMTTNALEITNAIVTTGIALSINGVNSLTTGKIALFRSDGADPTTRDLVKITNDNVLAVGTTALTIQQDASQRALFLDQNGNSRALHIDSEGTTVSVIDIDNPLTTTGDIIRIEDADALISGSILNLKSNSANISNRILVNIHNDNALAVGAIPLSVRQDSTAEAMKLDKGITDGGFINFIATADADITSAISTLITSGATTGHIQIEINGVKAWIAVSTNAPTA